MIRYLFLFVCLTTFSQDYLPEVNGELIEHKYYSLSYIEEHEQAEWVCYQLTKEMVGTKLVERRKGFLIDRSVSTGSANDKDYTKSGYDRGHLVPAADMRFDSVAMRECFYMSNVAPQVPEMNQGSWRELEEWVRRQALEKDSLIIVTGSNVLMEDGIVFSKNGEDKKIGKNEVSIPLTFYKIIYSIKDNKAIGFMRTNREHNFFMEKSVGSIDYFEEFFELDFFQSLDSTVQASFESTVDTTYWKFDGVRKIIVQDSNKRETPEIPAEFPGGQNKWYEYIMTNFRLPTLDEELLEGTLYASFRIDEYGDIIEFKVLRGGHPLYETELERVFSSAPKWKPAMLNGKAVVSDVKVLPLRIKFD